MPRAPPPPLNETRMSVVEAAWHKIAQDEDRVPLDKLKAAFDASRHPRVLDGNMSVGQAKEIIARHFDSVPDGVVTWEEFLQYHVRMSKEVDRSRDLDRDGTFVSIVVREWRLDKDPELAMQPTGIIPSTLDCPEGLKRTRNMDLVWSDPAKPGAFLAFKGAAKSRFARRDIPAHIRGHFAYADEMSDMTVKACVARSAFLSPLCIVWADEAGQAKGFRGVISQNIERAQLPEALRNAIMPEDDAVKAFGAIEWLPLEEVYNPTYQKSSQSFGVGAQQSAENVLTLKRKVYQGDNCGLAWHGHTGKFTDGFNGGPYKFSGLNTAPR